MKELDFLEIIKNTLSRKDNIGDDCAYLKSLGIVVTQDSLVEDVHFSMDFSSPYQLAYKAVCVNLSDIFASGAEPKYITVSLSLPENIDEFFIKEFYRACEDLSLGYDFEVVGGDITGSEKIFVSICAIGITENRRISSRSNARIGDLVVTTGAHGSSAAGLHLLREESGELIQELVESHLMPKPQKDFSREISTKIDRDYSMMDTSDGLMDAVFKIAQSSEVKIELDFGSIPYDLRIEEIAQKASLDYKDWILYGGEDYQLVACADRESLSGLSNYTIIGKVVEKTDESFVEIDFCGRKEKIFNLEKTFNHFRK